MVRRLTLLVATTVAIGSCSSEGGQSVERSAHVYAAVIRALVSEPPGHPDTEAEERDRVVYAGPLGGKVEVSLEVQVAVVEELEEFATIRFVDSRNEAIDDDERGEPVREHGALVLLGSIPDGRSVSIEAARYVDVDETARFRVTVERSGRKWTVVNAQSIAGRRTA
jgi:hypothetical protein